MKWSVELVRLTVVTTFFGITCDIWRDTKEARITKSKHEQGKLTCDCKHQNGVKAEEQNALKSAK